MNLNARVGIMPNGVTIVVCSSPETAIPKNEHNKILTEINEKYTVEESLFLSHGVIVRVKGKTVILEKRRGRW